MQLKLTLFVSILTLTLVSNIKAQTSSALCTEKGILDAVQNNAIKYSDDTFFWSGAFDKPLIGQAAAAEASKKVAEERNHEVVADHPGRIVVSTSGDMAYEYGTGSLSYEERKTRKHVSFEIGYLRVWKLVDGDCKAAASLFKPIESTIRTK
jgi:ketosteroid isomerase-like protein